MAQIKKAMKWLKEGKKITKPNWQKDSYLYMDEDYSINYADGTKAYLYINQILSNDWKIFEENKLILISKQKVFDIINTTPFTFTVINEINNEINKIEEYHILKI
jgi:hypothetical protein